MGIVSSTVEFSTSYTVQNTVVAGSRPVKVSDVFSLSITPAVATYQSLYRARFTLAAAATQVIDLANFTDPYNAGAAVTLTKATSIGLYGTQDFKIQPNGTNSLNWIFGITANYLQFGANEGFQAIKAVTFTIGSKLLLTNQGASSGTFDLAIIGGT